MSRYHHSAVTVAAVTAPVGPEVPPQLHDALRREITEIASKVAASIPVATSEERQFLKDIRRSDRYTARWLTRLAMLAARCPKDSDALAIADRLGSFIRGQRQPAAGRHVSMAEAIRRETEAQGRADLFEVQLLVNADDPGMLRQAADAMNAHAEAVTQLRDLIERKRAQVCTG